MELLIMFLLGTVFAIFSFAIVFNLATGKFKPKSNLGFMLAVIIISVFSMLFFPNEPLEKNLTLMKSVLLPAVVYLVQVMWYIGPLRPMRQRRIKRLRAKWQEDLWMWKNWVEALEFLDTLDKDYPKKQNYLAIARKEASRLQHKLNTVF